MKSYFTVPLCFILLLLVTSASKPAKLRIFKSNYEQVLGTSMELKIFSSDKQQADLAERAVLNEIDRLNNILSSYESTSEFSRWAETYHQPVRLSDELIEVMGLFDKWQLSTHGALNPAAEVVGQLWKAAAKANKVPDLSMRRSVSAEALQNHWQIDQKKNIAIHTSRVPLALNTFVKSYIIQKAGKAAMAIPGIEQVVVNIGGDMVISGEGVENIEISNPLDDAENASPLETIQVQNKAVATSGNYRRGMQIGDKWYSHIVDPRNATPVDHIISATIVSDDASEAGALATALNVLDKEASLKLLKDFPEVAYLIIDKKGDVVKSDNWNAMLVSSPAPANIRTTNNGYELVVSLELALIAGQRIHRPFVAVWIEDEAKKPVKNIAIWYNKDRWLPDLKNWFRVYGMDYKSENGPVKSTTGATRSAGKYTLKWNGLDDNGKAIKPGNYTVNIEVVREHGTYQIISKKINFNSKAQKYTFPANDEVASASIEYKKKTN